MSFSFLNQKRRYSTLLLLYKKIKRENYFTMEELQDLKKRIDHLQYGEINPLKEEVNGMKITLSNNDLLTKQAVDSNKKLNETMDTFKETMIEIAQSVRDSNKVTGQLADTVEELNNKISSVETKTADSLKEFNVKLDAIDEKSKIDIMLWMKQNWFGIVGICGLLYTVIANFVK